MFCPNCGTQNPDAAQNCTKCNFVLKNVAAPKFKGTMLMMNPPVIPGVTGPAAPRPPTPAPPAPPPPPAPAAQKGPAPYVPNPMKGTMVGVAPMAGHGFGLPAPVAVPSPGPVPPRPQSAPQAAPKFNAPPAAYPPFGQSTPEPAAYSPPIPQPGVNPLGGTLAADRGLYAPSFGGPRPAGHAGGALPSGPSKAFASTVALPQVPSAPSPPEAPLPGAFGPPPNDQGSSGPAPGTHAFGPPPYGAAVSPGAFGAPPAPSGLAPYGSGVAKTGASQAFGGGSAKPTRRNAMLVWLLPLAVMVGGIILSTVLALAVSAAFSSLSMLFLLGGCAWYVFYAIAMTQEIRSVTRNDAFAWWPILVPLYNLVWILAMVPQEVTHAKQIVGAQIPTRSVVLYFFAWPYAMAADVNDLVRT